MNRLTLKRLTAFTLTVAWLVTIAAPPVMRRIRSHGHPRRDWSHEGPWG